MMEITISDWAATSRGLAPIRSPSAASERVDVGIVIPAHDVKTLLAQALRYRRAHPAQSDNSEIHDVLPDPHNAWL